MSHSDPQAAAASSRARRIAGAIVKWGLLAAVLVFVGRALYHNFGEVRWSEIRFDAALMALAVASVAAARAIVFLPYALLVSRFGHRPPWSGMIGAVWISQVARYVPGKVSSVVSMALALRRYGVPDQVAVSTLVIVDGLSVVIGMLVAIPITLWEPVRQFLPMAWLWCILGMAAALVCLHPRVFGTVGNFLLVRIGYKPFASLPRLRDYVRPALALALTYVLFGVGYWLMARSLGAEAAPADLPIFICAVTVVLIGGFLAFFAPAGLGVQEGLLLVLLGPMIGAGPAAIIAVLMRLLQTVTEAGLGAVGLALLRKGPKIAEAAAPPSEDK
jgi:hypothetical protein